MSAYGAGCEDCVICKADDCVQVAFCRSEPCGATPFCEDHDAEVRMFKTGIYDPEADPLYNHTATKPVDRIERDGGYQWDGGWTEVPRHG